MYRAVADQLHLNPLMEHNHFKEQLETTSSSSSSLLRKLVSSKDANYMDIRQLASNELRTHEETYAPFVGEYNAHNVELFDCGSSFVGIRHQYTNHPLLPINKRHHRD